MIFKRLVFQVLLIFSMAFNSYAIDCGPADVVAIQAQPTDVLVNIILPQGEFWKALGMHSQESTKSYQSIAQQAMASGKKIYLRFPDGHNCAATDYSTQPDMIRVVN